MRRTKIIATVGPATDKPGMVEKLLGVYPVYFDNTHTDPLEANKEIIENLLKQNIVKGGDIVIITKGDLRGRRGGTNNMKIVQVGKIRKHTM